MVKTLSFTKAVADAQAHSERRPSVLLGNGFSIDCRPDAFAYDALARRVDLDDLHVDHTALFGSLGSTNFETIIDRLHECAAVAELYDPASQIAARMRDDARGVRRGLARALAAVHPNSAMEITPTETRRAATFLANFESTFTVSYDLLLYWVILKGALADDQRRDGFEWPSPRPSERLIWKPSPSKGAQHVFFLHGALHLFEDGEGELTKLNQREHGQLIRELRRRLDDDDSPLVVTEGRREEKEARIDKSPYLRAGLRTFTHLDGPLFIHGMSLSDNDEHLLEPIEDAKSGVTALYVGVHTASAGANAVINRAQRIRAARKKNGGEKLRLRFYDTATAHVWR